MMNTAQGYQFTVWQSPSLPKGEIEQDGNWFKLSMRKTAGTRNYTIAIGNTPDVQVPSQYKLLEGNAFRTIRNHKIVGGGMLCN